MKFTFAPLFAFDRNSEEKIADWELCFSRYYSVYPCRKTFLAM